MNATLSGPGLAPAAVTLYFRAGGSDTVYTAAVEPSADGFIVTFTFGRRGGTFQAGVPLSRTPPRSVPSRWGKEKAFESRDQLVPYGQTATPSVCPWSSPRGFHEREEAGGAVAGDADCLPAGLRG